MTNLSKAIWGLMFAQGIYFFYYSSLMPLHPEEAPSYPFALRHTNTAHHEDSLAVAEHLDPERLARALTDIGNSQSAGVCLDRAWLNVEYALSTPDTHDDEMCFVQANAELQTILKSAIPTRHHKRVNANMLLAYLDVFRARANNEPVTEKMQVKVQEQIGHTMLDFLGEEELSADDCGPLSELVADAYLMNGGHFPYLASRREEGNLLPEDNHDLYTLHPCRTNTVRKAPLSVKFRECPVNPLVVTLCVGRMAVAVAQNIPPYSQDKIMRETKSASSSVPNQRAAIRATRLAADIITCAIMGDDLSPEDQAFMWGLTAHMQAPVLKFVGMAPKPNYAKNADRIEREMRRLKIKT